MRALFLSLVLAFTGCVNLNSPPTPNHASSEMKKPCSCPGMEQCGTGRDGKGQCCTPDDCSCKQITAR